MVKSFQPSKLDFMRSPYTGLTREAWLEAGKYLLEGIFSNIRNFRDPVVVARYEFQVSYPNEASPSHKVQAEYFEGLARSFFLAAPLIHEDPELKICGYSMREYYKSQVLRACTEGDPNWVLDLSRMMELEGDNKSAQTFQQTVETCALVICLWLSRNEIWHTYTKEEKDVIASFLRGFGEGNTIPHNWRLFNMLDLAFLHMEGYEVDEDIMRDHAQAILSYYSGDGWYRDGQCFDYYSCWAFNVYTAFWNLWYGYEKEPYLAARFEENSNKLMETYGSMFDRDGWTNMWGRSNIYRNGATSAFVGNLFMKNHKADPGLARRISSGSLMQFLSRDDLLCNGVPSLGFYGPFSPMVQSYSCAESPFWLAKAFLCLGLEKEHPFWTAAECGGVWDELAEGETRVTTLEGPGLCIANHEANAATELRTGKAVKRPEDQNGMWNYCKLAYHTKFPWEAEPTPGVETQQYVLKDETRDGEQRANAVLWHGEKAGVLYRRSFFGFSSSLEYQWTPAVDLADFTVPYGLVRADKIRLFQKPLKLTLGSYGFPDNNTQVIRRERAGAKAIILKGCDHMGRERQMAMTVFDGWDELTLVRSKGTNPDSENSIVICAALERKKQYGYEPYLLISQTLTRDSLEDFSDEELFSVAEVSYSDREKCGGYGPVTLTMRDGSVKVIDFYGIEGKLLL